MQVNILHICNGFNYKRFYNFLFLKLVNKTNKQIIFSPTRDYLRKIEHEKNENISIYDNCSINITDRLFFLKKIYKLKEQLLRKDIQIVDITHAHSLYSDGYIALKIKRELNIKYIVAVRNTDIYIFFKFLKFYKRIGLKILLNADKIIFISPSHKKILFKKYIPKKYHKQLQDKCDCIPNGLNDYWITNKSKITKKKRKQFELIYVGDFTPNKNIKYIIKAIIELNSKGYNYKLNIVGGGGYKSKKTLSYIYNTNKNIINYHGIITDISKLHHIYSQSDIFIMPSFNETFGIVYLEAMSQGLPIIYTKGQGIDGYFPDKQPGIGVNPMDLNDIKSAIIKITNNIENYSSNSLALINNFSWEYISSKYSNIYNSL